MEPSTKHLVDLLDEIIVLLESDGEIRWRKRLAAIRSQLLNANFDGIGELLSIYGGMGSFNDLVIGQSVVDGRFRWKPGAREANDKLNALRSEAYELAHAMKRNHPARRE